MGRIEQIAYSNKLRDKIIEIVEDKCFAEDKRETPTPLAAVYPLLHFLEGELHEYGKHLQGKVLDLTQEIEDAKYEIETLRGQIVDRDIDLKDLQENVNDLNDSLHNSETELDKLKSERKKIIEANASQAMKISFLEPYKERYESAILEGDLLRTKNEELQERIIECEGDYQDICELTGELCLPMERQWLIDHVGRENWERFKNHIGW